MLHLEVFDIHIFLAILNCSNSFPYSFFLMSSHVNLLRARRVLQMRKKLKQLGGTVTHPPKSPGWKERPLVQPPAQKNITVNTRSGQLWLCLVRP